MLNVAPLGSETQVMYEKAGISPSAPYFYQNKESGNFAINDSFENIRMLFESFGYGQQKV